jgi:hypothetical protein
MYGHNLEKSYRFFPNLEPALITLFERGGTGRRWTTPDSSSWPITRFGKAIAFVVNNNIHKKKRQIASL